MRRKHVIRWLCLAVIMSLCLSMPAFAAVGDTGFSDVAAELAGGRILIAYFSRAGENWEVGNIEKGNTQIIAEMIAAQTSGELFHIQTAEPYPEDYMETVRQAQTEREAGARPELAANVENWNDYDTIFLGYPIWGGDMPMAVYTFIESHDWTGKTIVPFNTHGGSGQSGTVSSIRSTCTGATVHSGIAISGVTAQNDRESARSTVTAWLEEEGLAISDNAAQADYDFSVFTNVEITGVNISALSDEELSVLNANAYGASGTYRMSGTHRLENIDGQWMSVNR